MAMNVFLAIIFVIALLGFIFPIPLGMLLLIFAVVMLIATSMTDTD